MAAQKVYQIQINGLTESINAVDALNKQLDNLDKRINDLQSKNIKLNTSSGAKSALSEEEAIQREINKLKKEGEALDAKIVAAQDEVYKKVDATKQLYKETLADQKAIAAQERLTADAYSNTMQGMKSHLADLKAVINTTDLGDADKIGQMTKQANELTSKLKEMEEAYGQFGRNVGNYAEGVADGLSKVKINVGGAVREFDNAKQAAKTLGNELKTMAVNGEQGTDKFKELQKAVAQLNSDIKDATVSSKAMDNLLDTMQSFAAIGSVTQGFSALFGFDDAEIQRSIQKLVALQNVMQGIEKINQQMNSGEGIGGWLAKGNAAIDSFVESLTSANKAQEALNTSTIAGKTASEGLAAAETAQATATAGATVATKALGVALKALGIGLVISAIAALITYWDEIYDYFVETVPALKNLSTWFDKIRAVAVGVGTVVLNYLIQPFAMLAKTIQALISGNFSEIPKIIADGYKNAYSVVGNFQKGYNKEIERQQEVHNEKMREEQKKANDEWLKDEEAKYGTSHKRTQEYLKKQMALTQKGSDEYKDLQRRLWEDERKEKEENQKKSIASSKKFSQEETEVTKTINDIELRLMKDGLNKKLRQLDEEERQTLNKLKSNSRITADELRRIQKMYYQLRVNEMEEYLREINEKIKQSAKDIKSIEFDIDISVIETRIQSLKNQMEKLSTLDMSDNSFEPLSSRSDLITKRKEEIKQNGISSIVTIDDNQLKKSFESQYKITAEFYKSLIDELITFSQDEKAINEERIKEQEKQEKFAENNRWHMQEEALSKQKLNLKQQIKDFQVRNDAEAESLEQLKKDLETIENQISATTAQHNTKMTKISEATKNTLTKNELDTQKEISSIQEKYYNLQISNFRDLQSKINNEMQRQPVTDLIGFGIVNLKQSTKNYREIQNAAIEALNKIKDAKKQLDKSVNDKLISDEAAAATQRELDDLEQSFKQTEGVVSNELKDLTGKFIDSIGQYINAVGQTIQGIMSAVWEFEDYQFDKQQEELDKWNEELDKALDEQEDIISEHSDKINSIEDELASSRGDRRQHLIDQLNAEIQAQREAEKERQRIEKEQEKAQKRQDALDKKRKMAEYERNLKSILLSGAMAVTNAFATQPFVPVGIAMGALATTLTAVQYALAKQQKPYAKGGQLDGGVAVGNRHRDGGIKVLGGRAEIEGGEFITNRISTQMNAPLLEFINSKKKRIDISDMIDFYSSGSVKKNIANVRTKFEDGGYMPTLPNALDVRDQLQNIIINQDNRPIYVSVVDINNKQEEVRKVQTLAGL